MHKYLTSPKTIMINPRKFFVFYILLFSIVTLAGCLPEDVRRTERSSTVIVKIADRTFQIPREYIDLDPNKDVFEGDVLLGYVLPDYTPHPPHPEQREKRKELIMQGRMRGMLLEASAARPTFDVMVNNFIELKGYKIADQDVYGLRKYVAPQREGQYAEIPDEMYVDANRSQAAKGLLFCSPPGKDRFPSCNQRFRHDGLLYKIRWSLDELPRWQKQKEDAIRFLKRFEVVKRESKK